MVETVLDQRALVDIGTGLPDDVGLHRLTRAMVLDADDARLGHRGMRGQHVLDLGRKDVEAGHDHEVLRPVDEIDEAVVVGRRHVAGQQPTVVEDGRAGSGIAVVAVEHVRPAHPDLADVADEGVAVRVDEPDVDPVEGAADRAGPDRVPERRRDRGRRLGQPVALGDLDPEPFVEPPEDRHRKRRRTRQRDSHVGERFGRKPLEIGERRPHRRDPRYDGDSARPDRVGGGSRVEALDQHDGRADGEAERHHDVQAEDVEQRQHAEDHVVRRDVARRLRLANRRPEVAVAERRSARGAGGATGEDQHGGEVGTDLGDRNGLVVHHVVERQRIVARGRAVDRQDDLDGRHGVAIDARPGCRARFLDDDRLRAGARHLGLQLRCRAERIQRHGDRTEADHGEIRGDEVRAVPTEEHDAIADVDPVRRQPAAEAIDRTGEFAVRGLAPRSDQRDRPGVVTIEDVGEVHPLRVVRAR